MAKFKVLITDPLSEEGLKLLEAHPDIEFEVVGKKKPEELVQIIEPYDILLVRSGTKVTREVIERAKNLKLIGRAGVGLDNIDVEAATEKGVVVVNAPSGNTISTAEHTWALLMAMMRKIPQAYESLKKGEWNRKAFLGNEVYGKTLGIVGLGRIGSEVAKRALAFGMRVIGYDPFITKEKADRLGIELVSSIDELLPMVDIITFHIPLTEETRHLLNRERIYRLKQGAWVVNCARGGIVEEEALYEALKEGHLSGAALDVFEKEPPEGSPLLELPNVVFTPHLGASTKEAQINVAVEIAQEVINFVDYGFVKNAVNIPSFDPAEMKEIAPFMELAEKIGTFQSQVAPGRAEVIELLFIGGLAEKNVTPLVSAFLKGYFETALGDTVNYLNSMKIARERGIKVLQFKINESEGYSNLFASIVKAGEKKRVVAGTVFEDKHPRIVKIDDFFLEFSPKGYVLLLENRDVPGVIGKVGSILGENGVNIAGLHLGRTAPGKRAVSVIIVDSSIPEEVLRKIEQEPEIFSARLIKL